ncbi:MAG: indolepyruvate oxidoreductase subunit beta [Euryarchaeota archaeon]|nr:indolepyruvate oxidoreductase subunit beta [Euryarchaeota archaeon]
MSRMSKFDCIIVGVGGQGSIFASRVLGEAALREGYEITSAETHGMAQRGGTVEVHVRLGSSYGPLIPLRTADAIVGLEPTECVRFARYVSPNGTAIVNTCPIPAPGITYPPVSTLIDVLSLTCQRVIAYNATKLALEAGNPKTLNVVMLGTLSRFLSLSTLEEAIADYVPKKALAANLKAFRLGKNAVDSA